MVEKIIWTPEAEKSFEEIISYMEKEWTQKEIAKFIRKTDTVVGHIARFPLAYRTSGKEDVREAVITKQTILLYRISGKTVYLLYYWDTRKNPVKKPI